MAESMAEGDFTVPGRKFANVYSAWADGDWGMIMSGNVQIDPAHLGSPNDLTLDYSRLEDPKYIEAWGEFSSASQSQGAPSVIQINHPGRQSPAGAGNRGFFSQAVAPSAVPLSFGPGILANLVRKLVFGKPRALSTVEISEITSKFVKTAVHVYKSGFKGVELHVAHGYLLGR
jgi:2,4-dienoyl-CoA reductase-like NADH-dependent reductase (Old Yellow Enzyme family)